MNLLVIPFPFLVSGQDFEPVQDPSEGRDGYFSVRQGWVPPEKASERLTEFVTRMVEAAQAEVGVVHQIVFPECALTSALIEELADRLGGAFPELESVIAGTLDQESTAGSRRPINSATVVELIDGKVADAYSQRKHHRWRMIPPRLIGTDWLMPWILEPTGGST